MSPILAISASADGQLFASVAEDGARVFDVINFGVYHLFGVILSYSSLVRHDQ